MELHYWDTAGAAKTFTHPINVAWMAGLDRSARILDYGCGYGRVMAELSDMGFADVTGVDVSAALIERGRQARPDLSLAVLESPPAMAFPAGSFDVVVLFAVLTCIPAEEDQRALVRELGRVLGPGGILYVSDLLLQPDIRNRERYAAHPGPYGVFTTDDGAVCRHHDVEYLRELFAEFEVVEERRISVTTMNGRQAEGIQMLARRR
ncbi:class I SAM-dependent methyltransferase [Actinoplanes sp. GCM10030250]|uniref:class I SAM-dependent methyltransferase n=1 Tax=Actinoplanes sp. GCM10030250 TaxID=3273376 RepID=UPI00362276AE